jgi:hypothetical protein
MSQQSSDPLDLFDDVESSASAPGSDDFGFGGQQQYAGTDFTPTYGTRLVEKRGFDIYSLLLILSFIMLSASAIVLYMDAGKY